MGVSEKFSNFNSNIRISTENKEKISSRYKQITKRLNSDFYGGDSETLNSLYVGSYGRDTDIHVSDIDILFILPSTIYKQYNEYYGNGQSALLQAVKTSIEKTYSITKLKADGQVIIVPFTDKIIFEVVPCFKNNDGSFTFPNTNNGGSWKTTNPKPEKTEIQDKNIEWNRNLKRLCRMGRAWKDKWNVSIGGLLIDTLAYNFLKNWEHKDKSYTYYDWMSRDFFEYLKNQDTDKKYWLAVGSNQQVYRKGNFEYSALRCYNISLEAIKSEDDGYSYTASSKWIEVFGSKFNY